jgi:hypothetical protein
MNLRVPMSSLLQDRPPFMPAGFFYCGFRDYSSPDVSYRGHAGLGQRMSFVPGNSPTGQIN